MRKLSPSPWGRRIGESAYRGKRVGVSAFGRVGESFMQNADSERRFQRADPSGGPLDADTPIRRDADTSPHHALSSSLSMRPSLIRTILLARHATFCSWVTTTTV